MRPFFAGPDNDSAQYPRDLPVCMGMDRVSQIPVLMASDRKSHIAQVFRDMSARLRRFVRSRVPSDAEADDVVQDVWERFAAALDVRPVEQVAAWLFTVARNRIIDRSRQPQPVSLDALAEGDPERDDTDFHAWMPADDKTPLTEHLRHQFWEQLQVALAELPADQRQVFVWHEFENLSFQDIAELTGENLNTLLSRKRYAVLHLRERLRGLRDDFRAAR